VIPDDGSMRITETGRSVLKALEGPNEASLELSPMSTLHSLKLIDDLIGTEKRLRIFDLELRGDEIDFSPEEADLEDSFSMSAMPADTQETGADLPPEKTTLHETGEADLRGSEPIAVIAADPMPADAPGFLVRRGSRLGAKALGPKVSQRSNLSRLISITLSQALTVWRRHLERDMLNIKSRPGTGNVGGAAIALLSLLVTVICAGVVIALTQIRSLKSEVATLQRELSPLKERVAKTESDDRAKQDANQQRDSQNKSGAERNRAEPAPRTDQAALNLTTEEVRLIRDYIKPTPATGAPAPAISVGDTISSIATIPLPSPLMEKIPKLLGARFTTRNGAIIIIKRDSHQADALLPSQ
jgi:hypothetical protein